MPTKQVKIDNWGVFFLQRLKHFFNRTDYCDLTLQFQGYAQLKVHRLVLNACTEYFEMLEKTCEMYEDCLMMPDDLQVDVIVPIINFMYTGQLEYECHLFDKLYTTADVMNMSVLTKLLDAQRDEVNIAKAPTPVKKDVILMNTQIAKGTFTPIPSTSSEIKFSREPPRQRLSGRQYGPAPGALKPEPTTKMIIPVKHIPKKARYEKPMPTRYEVPEELENENLFEMSFADISYESQPLMKSYKREKREPDIKIKNIYDEASCSRKFEELQASSSSYKRQRSESVEDSKANIIDQIEEYNYNQKVKTTFGDSSQCEEDIFDTGNDTSNHNADAMFSQLSDNSSQNLSVKFNNKNTSSNLDHAKIISEVLKKYPHLVKSNKNIKLKIMPGSSSSKQAAQSIVIESKKVKAMNASPKVEFPDSEGDWSYYNKNLNQDSVAKLVSLGVANTSGPWLCLICGTPGKAINFPTYNKFYRHLADVHLEKIPANICEHCGYKSAKRNHLLYHMFTKHGVPPPSQYNFPSCNQCSYVALTKAYLIKHKLSHADNREFNCNVCNSFFKNRSTLLQHIQVTGHKISPDRKTTNQCVYCNKIFLREANLYTHLKLAHKELARKDGIIDNSDDEDSQGYRYDYEEEFSDSPRTEHVRIRQEQDGKIQIVTNKKPIKKPTQVLINKKLLNEDILENVKFDPKYGNPTSAPTGITISSDSNSLDTPNELASNLNMTERIVMFNDNEYVIKAEHEDSNISIHQQQVSVNQEAILPDLPEEYYQHSIEVSMPQQTSTTPIMTQKQVKTSYRVNTVDPKNHPIIVSNSQPYKTLISGTPVIFTTNMSNINTASSVAPKYVQAQASNINLASSSADTIMVLQEGDLNIDQSIPSSASNIVVVYSHPIGSNDKQYVHMNQQQFTNQYSGDQQIITHEQTHEVNTGGEMIISDHIIQESVVNEEWNENNMEQSVDLPKESAEEEIVDHQDIPIAENEGVEIIMDQNTDSTEEAIENIHEHENQTHEVVISNEEKVYNEEVGEYGDTISSDVVAEEEQIIETPAVENIEPMEVDHSIALQDKVPDTIISNQNVEWSDDELASKEIHQDEPQVDTTQEGHQEDTEVVEESIENIEKEVQKHMSESLKEDGISENALQISCPEEIATDVLETEAEEVIPAEDESVVETEEEMNITEEAVYETTDISANNEEQIIDETEVITETVENTEAEEKSTVEEVISEDNSENNQVIDKQKSAEKISTLLHDWDDNDSQPETVGEEQEAEDSSSANNAVVEDVEKEDDDLKNGGNVPVKVANIDNIVNDWEEEDEK